MESQLRSTIGTLSGPSLMPQGLTALALIADIHDHHRDKISRQPWGPRPSRLPMGIPLDPPCADEAPTEPVLTEYDLLHSVTVFAFA